MDASHDTPKPGSESSARHRSGTVWIWVLFVLFVVYPLSVGLVAKLVGNPAPPLVRQFYTPLAYLYNHSDLVQEFYHWYFRSVWRLPYDP